jgi:hypothetical protein
MGSFINRGWRKSAKGATQPTGIITGANLKKPTKPGRKPVKNKAVNPKIT